MCCFKQIGFNFFLNKMSSRGLPAERGHVFHNSTLVRMKTKTVIVIKHYVPFSLSKQMCTLQCFALLMRLLTFITSHIFLKKVDYDAEILYVGNPNPINMIWRAKISGSWESKIEGLQMYSNYFIRNAGNLCTTILHGGIP